MKATHRFQNVVVLWFLVALGPNALGPNALAAELLVPQEYPTIQSAIDAASPGDEVVIAPGTYHEHALSFLGKAIVVRSEWPFDPQVIDATVVHGDDLDSVFIFDQGESSLALLTGLTIRSGRAFHGGGIRVDGASPTIRTCVITSNRTTGGHGAGLFLRAGATLVDRCVITNNVSLSRGGGVAVDSAFSRFEGCTISGNRAPTAPGGGFVLENGGLVVIESTIVGNSSTTGGGVYSNDSELYFDDVQIWANLASFGGGLTLAHSEAVLERSSIRLNDSHNLGGGLNANHSHVSLSLCEVSANTVVNPVQQGVSKGGGIYASNGELSLTQCLVTLNEAIGLDDGTGAGLSVKQNKLDLLNVTFADNEATLQGGGMAIDNDSATTTIVNAIVWGNTPDSIAPLGLALPQVRYCDIQGGFGGIGILDVDPLFRDPTQEDYRLQFPSCGGSGLSPVIDAGSPNYFDSRLSCSWGLGTLLSDMGAFGGVKSN